MHRCDACIDLSCSYKKLHRGKRALKGGHLGFVVSSNKRISYSSEVFWLPLPIPLGCWEWDVAAFEAACPSHLFQQKVVLRNEGRIKNQSHWDVTNEFYTTSYKSCKHTHSKVAISSYKQKYIFVPKIQWIIRMYLEDAFVLGFCNGQSILFCNMFPSFWNLRNIKMISNKHSQTMHFMSRRTKTFKKESLQVHTVYRDFLSKEQGQFWSLFRFSAWSSHCSGSYKTFGIFSHALYVLLELLMLQAYCCVLYQITPTRGQKNAGHNLCNPGR